MAPSWSQTPDLCLLAIFKDIPLSDLLRNVGLVCKNWSRLQRDELKRRRAQTKTLVLIQNYAKHLKSIQQGDNSFGSELIEHVRREDGSAWVQTRSLEHIRFDAFLVPGDGVLSQAFVSPLMNILMDSNITQLTLVQRNLNGHSTTLALEQMTRLINHFSTSLVSLKVDLYFLHDNYGCQNDFSLNVIALVNSINQLTSLRHLTLNGNFPNLNQLSLPILSRLATFSTNRFEPTRVLISSLREIPTAANVRIDCDIYLALLDLVGFGPELAAKFTRIRVRERVFVHTMRVLGNRFAALTSLELTIDSMHMTAQFLAQQTELVHLKLYFDLSILEQETRLPRYLFSQIRSVRLLTLSFHTQSHRNIDLLYVPEIFPNLQVLHLSLYAQKCTECRYEVANVNQLMDEPALRTRIENCMRLIRQPFRRCTNLHTIKFEVFGQLKSIQPQGLITRDQL